MEISIAGGFGCTRLPKPVDSSLPMPSAPPRFSASPARSRLLARAALRGASLVLAFSVASSFSLASAGELNQARERHARGDLAGALAAVETGLARDADNAQLLFLQGLLLMDQGQDARALAIFETLNQRYPELPEPLNNIGLLQARAGRLESAQQSLLAALRADPRHQAARSNLGQVYLMLAVQAWETASAGTRADPALLRRLEAARAVLALPAR